MVLLISEEDGLIGLMWVIFWGSVYFGWGFGILGWIITTLAVDLFGQGSIGFLLAFILAVTFFPVALVTVIYKIYFKVSNRFLAVNLFLIIGVYLVFVVWGYSRWS